MSRNLSFAFLIALAGVVATPAAAQMSASDVVVRLDQIENQMRMLTGQVEQLQFRNQQLEQQLRRAQEEGGAPRAGAGQPQMQGRPQQPPMQQPPVQQQAAPQNYPPQQSYPSQQPYPQGAPQGAQPDYSGPSPIRPVSPGGRRSDVFDPNENPSAPGAPRVLGSLPPGQPSAPQIMTEEADGVRGGREPGAPLDLSTMTGGDVRSQGGPLPRGPNLASATPTPQTPKEQYDLGYSYIQRKDFGQAEETMRDFLRRYPNDRLTPDAHYWLGESLYQRQRYQDAAEAYLSVTTKFETAGKAPDALLRLGQSLAAMGQKEMACASFGEVDRKYPRASLSVKQGVERELKRVRC